MSKERVQNKAPFLKPLIISLFLLSLFIVFIIKQTWHSTAEDKANYTRLIAEADPTTIGESLKTPYSATQVREGVRKDLFFSEGCQRLHLCILSDRALLQVIQTVDSSALVEKLEHVKCFMQEGLFYLLKDGSPFNLGAEVNTHTFSAEQLAAAIPMQHIRYFESTSAEYNYESSHFSASEVEIIRYVVPGHVLSLEPPPAEGSLYGTASEVEFTFGSAHLDFKAKNFKARFRPISKGLKDSS